MKLPDPKLLAEKFLLRRNFRQDPQGTNLMFAFFAQHFTHQFFKTHNSVGLGFTKGLAHGVSHSFYNLTFSLNQSNKVFDGSTRRKELLKVCADGFC